MPPQEGRGRRPVMKYRTTAQSADSYECAAMRIRYPEQMQHDSHVPATMFLETDRAFIHFGGPSESYRPYLVLQGRAVKYQGEFPGSVVEATMDRDSDRHYVEYVYELNNENISDMALKGLYDKNFQVPQILKHNTWELPCQCEVYSTSYTYGDGDAAKEGTILFIRPEDGSRAGEENTLVCADQDVTLNGRTVPGSGYCVSDYFEDLRVKERMIGGAVDELEELSAGYEEALQEDDSYTESIEDDDLSRYAEEVREETQEEQPEDEMTPEEREAYEQMRRRAVEAWQETQAEDALEKAQEAVGELPEEPEEQPDEQAEVQKKVLTEKNARINDMENVDSLKELAEEHDDIKAGDAAYVDEDLIHEAKELAKKPGERKLPEVPEEELEEIKDDPQFGE